MVHPRHESRRERRAIVANAANADAREAHAVVGLLPADEHGPLALAPAPVIRQRHFHGCIDRSGAAHGEKHLVEAPLGQFPLRHDGLRPLLRRLMAHHEGWRIRHGLQLLLDRLDHWFGTDSARGAPEACGGV
eukprot:scaffold757_cov246-Pinguiococcus_pyrenoidosus.AAC.3